MHFCIWRTQPKLMHEALYEYTRLQLKGRSLTKPQNLAQQLVVRALCSFEHRQPLTAKQCFWRACQHSTATVVQRTLHAACPQEAMRMTERQRHAIVLVYEAMMRELSSIFARHKALLASLSTAKPAPTAKTNGVRLV